jgi:uncharacterized C2H2 Zn-finger protein
MHTCNICNYTTGKSSHYKDHLKSKRHQININGIDIYKCVQCGQQLSRRDNLIRHYNKVHSIPSENIPKTTTYLINDKDHQLLIANDPV